MGWTVLGHEPTDTTSTFQAISADSSLVARNRIQLLPEEVQTKEYEPSNFKASAVGTVGSDVTAVTRAYFSALRPVRCWHRGPPH